MKLVPKIQGYLEPYCYGFSFLFSVGLYLWIFLLNHKVLMHKVLSQEKLKTL